MKLIYCHEHVTVDLSHEKNDPDCRLRDFEATLAEFRRLRELGVRAIMDQTNRGMGRDPEYVHRMAQESGLEIQLATGFYKEPFLPPEVYEMTERQLCTLMVDEIERGIGNSGLRAQHIGEVGSGFKGISPMEEKVLRAAARTQRETGVPLVTHASLGAFAPEQWKIFSAYGVPAEKVVISHVPLAHDEAYMLRVADLGVNLSFDTVGKEKYQPIEEALRFLTLLRDKGHVVAAEKKKYDYFAVEHGPLINFYDAEAYHQDYIEKNPGGYCHIPAHEIRDVAALIAAEQGYKKPTQEQLEQSLTAQQYAVTQNADTERAFTGAYWNTFEEGIYVDVTTGQPLFHSADKYKGSCGWPSFSAPIYEGVMRYSVDTSYGMDRIEVRSDAGDAHLGHIFTHDPESPNGIRYCINSASLRFIPKAEMVAQGYGPYLILFEN